MHPLLQVDLGPVQALQFRDGLFDDLVHCTEQNLQALNPQTPDDVQRHSENVVRYSDAMWARNRALKQFLYQNMYRHYRLMRMQSKAEHFISEIFLAYVREPKMLPTKTQERLESAPIYQVVTDYIAGMTDRYALDEWEKLFDPYRKA